MSSDKYVDILREIRDQIGREMEHQDGLQRVKLIRDKVSTNPALADLLTKAIHPREVRDKEHVIH